MSKFKSLIVLLTSIALLVFVVGCSSSEPAEEEQPIPKYPLHLDVAYESNVIFAKYDVRVLLDGESLGTVSQGKTFTKTVELEEGSHSIGFCDTGDSSNTSKTSISIDEETFYSCSLKAHTDSIDIIDEVIDAASEHEAKKAAAVSKAADSAAGDIEEYLEGDGEEITDGVEEDAEDGPEEDAEDDEEDTEDEVIPEDGTNTEEDDGGQAKIALAAAKLTQKSDKLECSNKETDPLKLVECSNEEITISTKDDLDLSKAGKRTIAYTLSLDGQTETRKVTFNVRDTKAPSIKLRKETQSVDQGDTYYAEANVKSVKDKLDGELEYVKKAPKAGKGKVGVDKIYKHGWYTVKSNVDTDTPGSYQVKITASDEHGNKKTKKFTVRVKKTEVEKLTYTVNIRTKVFHYPDCRYARSTSESNKVTVTATREEMVSHYKSCGHCNP